MIQQQEFGQGLAVCTMVDNYTMSIYNRFQTVIFWQPAEIYLAQVKNIILQPEHGTCLLALAQTVYLLLHYCRTAGCCLPGEMSVHPIINLPQQNFMVSQ